MNLPASTVHIERLDLDLRGVPPAIAEAAVRRLGPALQQALVESAQGPGATTAGHGDPLRVPAAVDAPALSTLIATRLAAAIRRQVNEPPSLSPGPAQL